MIGREFLDPKRKLVDGVADWLSGRARVTDEGAVSLDHLMVVVPTAQSGRNLRLALARRFAPRGIIPPRVVQPMSLVRPAECTLREASSAEVSAAFLKFIAVRPVQRWPHLIRPGAIGDRDAAFALLDQLLDIWRILCGRGLLMREVAVEPYAREALEAAAGDELERWRELGEFETEFFAFLEERGMCHPAMSVHLAGGEPAAIDGAVEEVVLPALADPVQVLGEVLTRQRESLRVTVLLHCGRDEADRFDGWGRPKVECWTGGRAPTVDLGERDIVCAADSSDLANRLAADFPPADSTLALPTLALCDGELYPEISAAFLNAGYVVHNPECQRLAASSLGRLVRDLLAVWQQPAEGLAWSDFVAVFRSDDVMGALVAEGLVTDRAGVLEGLDIFQNRLLPQRLTGTLEMTPVEFRPSEAAKVELFRSAAKVVFGWLDEARGRGTLAEFTRAFLGRVFGGKPLTARGGDRELRAAAECVREVLDALSLESVRGFGLAPHDMLALARRQLEAATYSLEPESLAAIKTTGWLELAWSEDDRVALAGLHEGAVPDSVVGHAFLPDALRAALGLTTNAMRLARDTWLIGELIRSHATGAIRAYVARTDDAGDICRPSSLLFLCGDDGYARRAEYLFGALGEPSLTPPRRLSPSWRLRLPDEVPLPGGHLSASAIDAYLNSPLAYLLQYGLGMRRYEDKRELGADDFGKIVHLVLERYAQEQFAASEAGRPQLSDEEAIRERIAAIADGAFAGFGTCRTANLRLQLEAAKGRLMAFAAVQAKWAADGWRVGARPEYRFRVRPFPELDVELHGSVDRIDCRIGEDGLREYRLVDYKTWDRINDAPKHLRSMSEAQLAFADRLKLPTAMDGAKRIRLLTVQLPLYGRCLEVADPGTFGGRIVDYCYLVLGAELDDVAPYGSALAFGGRKPSPQSFRIAEHRGLALDTAKAAIRRIQANVFWPPRADENRPLYDLGGLFMLSPELDQGDLESGSEWLRRQEARLEALE